MNKQLQAKLKEYALSAGAVALAANAAEAQTVHYVNVDPDVVIDVVPITAPGFGDGAVIESHTFDLDENGTDDFIVGAAVYTSSSAGNFFKAASFYTKIFQNSASIGGLLFAPLSPSVAGFDETPAKKQAGDEISSGPNWNQYGDLVMFGNENAGYGQTPWTNSEAYLGIRLYVPGDTLYGWVRMQALSTGKVIIKDYAYKTGNLPILAGEGAPASAYNTHLSNTTLIHVNESKELVMQVDNVYAGKLNYQVTDLRGNVLAEGIVNASGERISLSSVPAGMYIVRLNDDQSMMTRKIFIR